MSRRTQRLERVAERIGAIAEWVGISFAVVFFVSLFVAYFYGQELGSGPEGPDGHALLLWTHFAIMVGFTIWYGWRIATSAPFTDVRVEWIDRWRRPWWPEPIAPHCDWMLATIVVMLAAGIVVDLQAPIIPAGGRTDAVNGTRLEATLSSAVPYACATAVLSMLYGWRKRVLLFALLTLPLQAWWWLTLTGPEVG